MKHILISIITYKNHAVTDDCLQSLEKIDTSGLKLSVVVINNDTEKDFTYTWKGSGEFIILNQKENTGFSGGHAIGMKRGLAENVDYVLVLNNDTEVKKDFLTELVHDADQHANTAIFVPKIYFAKGSEFHKDRYKEHDLGKVFWYAGGLIDWNNLILSHRGVDEVDSGQYDTAEETAFASGCCMLIRTNSIKEVGTFDERYFLYYEDSDFNERIKRAGFSVRYVPKSVIWHKNAGSTGGSGSQLQDYFISRNRLVFGYRYAPIRTKLALFRESLRLLRNGREWQKIGIRDYYQMKLGKGSYGV